MDFKQALMKYGEVSEYEAMSKHTSFRIGGKVRYAFYPQSSGYLKKAMALIEENGLAYKVIGKGSNLLWCDEDQDMVAIFMDRYMDHVVFHGDIMECEAGASTVFMAFKAMEQGLSGLEFASGIPGSIGGAMFMNAGAYNLSMKDIVKEVLILQDGEEVWKSCEEMEFSYRHSILQSHPSWIVLKVRLQMTPKDSREIYDVIMARKERRMTAQPLDMPCAGSTFKNPPEKPAWKCIEDIGMRGFTVGGAQVSEKHCNFLINRGNALASDVLALADMIIERVKEHSNIELNMEVEQYKCQRKSS